MNIFKSKILIAILACLIVLIGIGGYFYYQKKKEIEIKEIHKAKVEEFKKKGFDLSNFGN